MLILGADVGGTHVKHVVMTAAGQTVTRGSVATDPRDPTATLGQLAAALQQDLAGPLDRLAAVGLACAGIVSTAQGTLGRSPNLPGWEGLPLRQAARAVFGSLPVTLANDVNAALQGEWRLGAGKGCQDLVMVALGTGVGGGVIVGGRLVIGAGCGAGEIGHMVLDLQGPLCTCGNHGCLEAYAGEWALLRRARDRVRDPRPEGAGGQMCDQAGDLSGLRNLVKSRGERLAATDLHALACGGDEVARSLFAEAGQRLGQAVANVINVLDPDRVIIGGGLAQAGDLILAPCRAMVAQLVLSEKSRSIPIVQAELGPYAAALGAACLAGEEMTR